MFRPVFVAAGVMLVLSATIAAAIAVDKSDAARATMGSTPTSWGSTLIPASEEGDSGIGGRCPLPEREGHLPPVAVDPGPNPDLTEYGQSAIPDSVPAAICTGALPATQASSVIAP
jgi:hypothetical protein